MAWIRETDRLFDLIFLDPPTFSNSRRTASVIDVQRDHAGLIRLAMQRLARDGLLLFSTNFRRFTMHPEVMEAFAAHDITRDTIPPDFERNPKIHRCWEIRHRP
jgi:23S rRNA (guanine2445-N2)-methyltransferase / 23S rRNA (guanine2069-N7)-methyltransferase